MNRNKKTNFSLLPQAEHQRSTFDLSASHKFTFDCGELVPFWWKEILPGETLQIKTSKLVRMQTPTYPIMDNLYMDTYYFFVPNRLIWSHWKEFQGENNTSHWIPTADYKVPQIKFPVVTDSSGDSCPQLFAVGSVADYMGLPAGECYAETIDADYPHAPYGWDVDHEDFTPSAPIDMSFNALPFRAYALICNDWFRDENLEDPLYFDMGDTQQTGDYRSNRLTFEEIEEFSASYATPLESAFVGGAPYIVNKYHDYFTSALPSPQKAGDTVVVPVGYAESNFLLHQVKYRQLLGNDGEEIGVEAVPEGEDESVSNAVTEYYLMRDSVTGALTASTTTEGGQIMYEQSLTPIIDINSIRLAFATQTQYELDARGGTRYTEIIRSNFGVVSPDARLQRSEYLGGNHFPININQVVSQAEVNGNYIGSQGNLGSTGAYSLTADSHGDFIQSFTEHGIVIGVCCVRFDHSYQQGVNRMWNRYDRFSYYMPAFANIGEQGIKASEIFVNEDSDEDTVFGYQEAWSEYRYMPNRVSGEMRSSTPFSLDAWHLSDDYAEQPELSIEWLKEDKTTLDRCLKVTSAVANQFFADFFVDCQTTLPMPMYSVPATLGHF